MPQKKDVHVYHLFAELSAVDMVMRESIRDKIEFREDLMAPLRHAIRTPFLIPRLPTAKQLE